MTITATNGNADRQPRNKSNTSDFGSREAPEVCFPHPAGGNWGVTPRRQLSEITNTTKGARFITPAHTTLRLWIGKKPVEQKTPDFPLGDRVELYPAILIAFYFVLNTDNVTWPFVCAFYNFIVQKLDHQISHRSCPRQIRGICGFLGRLTWETRFQGVAARTAVEPVYQPCESWCSCS